MAVYLEEPTITLPPYTVNWARMTADTLAELHEFAGALGIPPHRFYDHRIPHYRLAPGKQLQAIKLGIVQITAHERLAQIAQQELEQQQQRRLAEQAAKAAEADQPLAAQHEEARKAEMARLQRAAKTQKKNRKTARRRGLGHALESPQANAGSKHARLVSGQRGTPKGIRHA